MFKDSDRQVQLYKVHATILFVLSVITFAAIVARLYVRVYLRGNILNLRLWGWSDMLLFLSWLLYLSCAVVNGMVIFVYGWLPPTIDEHSKEKHFLDARKLIFAYLTMFWVAIFILKGAMLCFFDEFVSKGSYFKSWVVIRILGVLVVIGGVSSFVYQMLLCQPFARNWNGINERSCWLEYHARFQFTVYRQVWHVVLDLMILCVPLPLIPLLRNVSLRQRIGLGVMLSLGLFCVIAAIVFTLGVLRWDNGSLQTPSATWFLVYEPVVEMPAAILIQCVPAIRFLLRGQGNKSHRASYPIGSESKGGGVRQRWRAFSKSISSSGGSRTSFIKAKSQSQLKGPGHNADVTFKPAKEIDVVAMETGVNDDDIESLGELREMSR